MSIRVTTLEDRDQWDDHVERSPQGTVFHQFAALETFAAHSGSTLHPLIGYKGEEPVGLFPVFELHKGPIRFVFSPPHELHVPNLGPVLLGLESMKQRKRERRHARFVEGCLEWLSQSVAPHYVSIRAGWRYTDVRPFKWQGFDVQPSYTYVLSLPDDPETLLGRFSKSARRHVRNNLDAEYAVEVGGPSAIEWIVERVNDRYEETNEAARISTAFVTELYDRLPTGQVRPYVLRVDGETVTGVILLEHGDTAHSWMGGAKPSTDLPVNELLEWHMMTDAMDRGVTTYEIVGADTPRLNEYKSKFGPDVRAFHGLSRSTPGLDRAVSVYRLTQERRSIVENLVPSRSFVGNVR